MADAIKRVEALADQWCSEAGSLSCSFVVGPTIRAALARSGGQGGDK